MRFYEKTTRVISEGVAGLKLLIYLLGFESKGAFCTKLRKIVLFLKVTSCLHFYQPLFIFLGHAGEVVKLSLT